MWLDFWVFPSLCLVPSARWFDDLGRDAQGRIDLVVEEFGVGGLANLKHGAVAGGKDHGDDLMGA